MKPNKILLFAGLVFILITIPVALFLVSQNQDTRQRASDDDTCTAPPATSSVTVDYPICENGTCNLTQASCEWESVSGASAYLVTVNQVEDGTIVKNQERILASTLKINFPVVQNKTYKCTVAVENSCAAVSATLSDELFCEADAIIDSTPTPTQPAPTQPPIAPTATPNPTQPIAPTATLIPTATPIAPTLAPTIGPTNTPMPTPAPVGGTVQTIGIIGGLTIIIAAGIMMILF